jgi:hypothetical protein
MGVHLYTFIHFRVLDSLLKRQSTCHRCDLCSRPTQVDLLIKQSRPAYWRTGSLQLSFRSVERKRYLRVMMDESQTGRASFEEKTFLCDNGAEEEAYAIGNPSYKDLAEENAYLRAERSQLYDQLAKVSLMEASSIADNTPDVTIGLLENELQKEKNQSMWYLSRFEYLKSEIIHLQFHGTEQAAVAKDLEERLQQSQECLHAANSEILQILPLRIKLNEMRQKAESVSGEVLAANNEIHQLTQERDRMKFSLESLTQLLETAQSKVLTVSRKVHDLKSDRVGRSISILLYLSFAPSSSRPISLPPPLALLPYLSRLFPSIPLSLPPVLPLSPLLPPARSPSLSSLSPQLTQPY